MFVVQFDELLSVAEVAVKSLLPLFVHNLVFEDHYQNANDQDNSKGEAG